MIHKITQERATFLQSLAKYIHAKKLHHPIRVAIDGADASGKTTLANELVDPLKKLGRPVIRASIDRFHKPREERYLRGKDSPEGYYFDSFNNELLINKLLIPLGENGSLMYESEAFDFKTNSSIQAKPQKAPSNAILLFDGVFLFRPELNSSWDVRIFLHVPFEEVLKRAKLRDGEFMRDEVEQKYKTRYIPGQKIYLSSIHPEILADITIDNSNVDKPVILRTK